ncbi:MAG: CRISPR-associated helicase Cas3' [Muribaculaceae bacterium]|nr:CRISPR-associated helicase Cas3' [Muribaculaceae bacterium]
MCENPTISHLYFDSGWHIQTNAEHCNGVAEFAAEFASEFGMETWGRMIGILHDRGKEGEGFQAHIKRMSGYDPDASSNLPSHHSLVGAKVAHFIPSVDQLYWLSNCIAGHHRGLYNNDELERALEKETLEEISGSLPDIKLHLPEFKLQPEDSSHLTRMLFSCLVDADWLDTERFMSPAHYEKRGQFASIPQLKLHLDSYLNGLHTAVQSDLNKIRTQIQNRCMEEAAQAPGFYSLTVPTGGGKTIASIVWALNHAVKYNKKRIIIAIPFTSIIVQTAEVLKRIFGEDNVIEHHSALNEKVTDERSRLACENWDAPIVVTTNVQFFESLFANSPTACRKLHSICNSVVILDEVQTLPLTFLQPIVEGMQTYSRLFKTSFLFTTATQPLLSGIHNGSSGSVFRGIADGGVREIMPLGFDLHNRLRRVDIEFLKPTFSYEGLGEKISSFRKMLCVVNTRKHAIELFNSLTPLDEVEDFHLSRYMCGVHILSVIDKIKALLKENKKGVRVIATQLIEAGVDIDFPVVFRQISGLDSILQAAGRCNREGKEKIGKTYVFSFDKDRGLGMMGFATDVMKDIISLNPDMDCFDPASISLYYKKLYSRTPYFDKERIGMLQNNPLNCQFEEIASKFHLIDETGINIIVNFGESEKLVKNLRKYGPSRKLSRELGRYSINVPLHLFKSLESGGLIDEPYKGFFFIPFKEQYDLKTGLRVDNSFLEQNFII